MPTEWFEVNHANCVAENLNEHERLYSVLMSPEESIRRIAVLACLKVISYALQPRIDPNSGYEFPLEKLREMQNPPLLSILMLAYEDLGA